GTWEGRTTPRRAKVPAAIKEIAAGDAHAVAVHADGTIFAWGFGAYGQLGNGQAERRRSTPEAIEGLSLQPVSFDDAFAALSAPVWLSPLSRWEHGELAVRGVAPSSFGYMAVFPGVTAGPGAPVQTFLAEGNLITGGVT